MTRAPRTTSDDPKDPSRQKEGPHHPEPKGWREPGGDVQEPPCQELPAMRRNSHVRGKFSAIAYSKRSVDSLEGRHYGTITTHETDAPSNAGGPLVVRRVR